MRHKFYLLILIATLSGACTPKKFVRVEVDAGPKIYGATVEDTPLTINERVQGLHSSLDKQNVKVKSYDLLSLSNLLMESDQPVYKQTAKKISDLFSHADETATAMNSDIFPPGNPYAEQVYTYLYPYLLDKFKTAQKDSEDLVNKTSQNMKPPVVIVPTGAAAIATAALAASQKTSAYYLQSILNQINQFNSQISQVDGSSDSSLFLKAVSDKLSTEYVKPLQDFLPKLTRKNGQSLSLFLRDLQKSLVGVPGLTDAEKASSDIQLQDGVYYSNRTEQATDSVQALQLIVDMWFNAAVRNRAPPVFKAFFANYTEKQIMALVTKNSPVMSDSDFVVLQKRADLEWAKKNSDFSAISDRSLLALQTLNKPLYDIKSHFFRDWTDLNTEETNSKVYSFVYSPAAIAFLTGIGKSQISDPGSRFEEIAFFWLNLQFRYSLNKDIISAFAGYDSDELEDIKNNPWWLPPKRVFIRRDIVRTIDSYPKCEGCVSALDGATGLRNFKDHITGQIQEMVEATLKSKIQALADGVASLLRTEVIGQLEKQGDSFPAKAFDYFKTYAKLNVDAWFFKGQKAPLLIPTQLFFEKKPQGWTVRADLTQTSAEILGASLSNYFFMMTYPQAIGILNPELASWSFRAVNQMASIAGYKNYSGDLIDSLTIPFTIGQDRKRFDILGIQSYDPTQVTFVVPDNLFLKNAYQANVPLSTRDPQVSVAGQMELLSGYVKMMSYLKPWASSTFDSTLNALRISQVPDKEIFPKKTLFKESLGLALGILLNMPSNMLGLITSDGKLVESANVDLPVGAALLNFSHVGKSHIIYTQDVAKSILALSDFYDVSQDLYKTDDPEIQGSLWRIICDVDDPDPTQALVPEVIKACITNDPAKAEDSARKKIHSLLTGLVLLTSGKLMSADGGFYIGMDANGWVPVKGPRRLFDQLLMEKALLRAQSLLKSDAIGFRAIDNFFFLNKNFWDATSSFYYSEEGSKNHTISIRNVLVAIANANRFKEFLGGFSAGSEKIQKSITQTLLLKNFWETRLLNRDALNQQPLDLLFPQYPILNSTF